MGWMRRKERICGGERDNDIFRRSMNQKTKELCKCVTLSWKKINVSCHKRTIIPALCHVTKHIT